MYNGQCTTECQVQSQAGAYGNFGIEINSGKSYWNSYHSASSLYSHGKTNPFEITVGRDCLVPWGIKAKIK